MFKSLLKVLAARKIETALVIAGLSVLAVTAVVQSSLVDMDRLRSNSIRLSPSTSLDPCQGNPACTLIAPEEFATLEAAVANASFGPRLPSNLPDGFTPQTVYYWNHRLGTQAQDGTVPHNDFIAILYRDQGGRDLLVSQGFPAMPTMGSYPADEAGSPLFHIEEGVVTFENREFRWMKGVLIWVLPPGPPREGALINWDIGTFSPGSTTPTSDATELGSTLSYTIVAEGLSLEELLEIAASVSFE